MTDKPTGVFVRLPLSDTEKMALTSGVKMGGDIEAGIGAIGTPVTGGEFEVVGFEVVHVHGADLTYCRDKAQQIERGADGIIYPLVRQSDALAKLAERDAEIARKDAEIEALWSALESIEVSIDALPDDMEDYSKMTAREMRRQALEVVKEEVKALKGAEA